jgi:hypothetical protein
LQTLTESVYRLTPPGGLFDESVVRNLFPDLTPGARRLLVHRAVKHGEVFRLKPGSFCLAPEFRKSHPHPFVVAAVLHSPSHVSLEAALAHHGLIPEAVQVVSSVTARRSRVFKTPLGRFSFHRVPAANPRAGVKATRVDDTSWAFIASPLRAVADLVYLRKEVRWEKHGLGFLTESMRIEEEDLRGIAMDGCEEVIESMRSRRVKRYLVFLRQELEQ